MFQMTQKPNIPKGVLGSRQTCRDIQLCVHLVHTAATAAPLSACLTRYPKSSVYGHDGHDRWKYSCACISSPAVAHPRDAIPSCPNALSGPGHSDSIPCPTAPSSGTSVTSAGVCNFFCLLSFDEFASCAIPASAAAAAVVASGQLVPGRRCASKRPWDRLNRRPSGRPSLLMPSTADAPTSAVAAAVAASGQPEPSQCCASEQPSDSQADGRPSGRPSL